MYLVEIKRSPFETKKRVSRKGNGSNCHVSFIFGPWRCIDSQAINISEFLRQVCWSDNLGDLKGKRPRQCTVINQLVDPKVQKLEFEGETSTLAAVDLQNDRSVVQSPKNLNRRDRIQILSKCCEVDFCWETTGVLEDSESSTSKAGYVQVPDNCTSVVSVVHPGNSSGESRLQVLSLSRVAEFEWENSSVILIEGLCVAISTREREPLSSFTDVLEEFEVYSVHGPIKITVHNKEVIETYRPDSEDCQELQRIYNLTLGFENQTCLISSEHRARL